MLVVWSMLRYANYKIPHWFLIDTQDFDPSDDEEDVEDIPDFMFPVSKSSSNKRKEAGGKKKEAAKPKAKRNRVHVEVEYENEDELAEKDTISHSFQILS